MKNKFPILFILVIFLTACGSEQVYTPKPRGFPKINYPERNYQKFSADYCHFTFEYPSYAKVQQDTSFFTEKTADPCWFDLVMPAFDARLHCSYYPIDKVNNFEKLRDDAFKMANKHIVKANAIDERSIQNANGVSGFVFQFDGPTATPFSFYLSDSTEHYIRCALYFNSRPRPDSLAPVINYVKEDLSKMIETFTWDK